jgi:Xaa-Pro aminopeptidase
MNRPRAQTVLGAACISALVLADPINIYHATGFWPRTLEMGHLGSTLAVVPADLSDPVILVTAQFLHYFQGADIDPEVMRVFLYTAPDETSPSGTAPPFFFRPTPDGPEDGFDRKARNATQKALGTRPAFADPASALAAALAGVTGRIAVDNFLPEAMLGTPAPFAFRSAEPLLRHIRMIKSPEEIALMRHAASSNAQAARAAVAAMRPGDRYDQLRYAYFAETGLRGGHPAFLEIDSAGYAQSDGTIRSGRCFQIDAVAAYAHYHGDYGRTVFVGAPEPALRRAMDAAILANEAIAARLGPGLRYSDVTRIGREAVAQAGLDVLVAAAPHSVGLFHTDEAFRDDSPVFAKADHLIARDMILSIDCPVLDTDIGGTVHLEDLWLITADGCEPINDTADPFLQI